MNVELQQKMREYMSENNISQAEMARKSGISEPSISRYLKGTYPNPETIEKKIADVLEKAQLRENVTGAQDIAFVMTTIAKVVTETLEFARLRRRLSVIYGDAGIGKTYATEEWIKDKTDVIKLTASPALGNPKSFFKYLIRELRTTKSGSIDDLYLEICARLIGTDKMIIVDEAQHLTLRALENIRGIQETAKIAIVLIGNETIYTKMIGSQQAEFAQLFSRIGWRSHLLTDHFVMEDVRKVFGEALDPAAHSLLLSICQSKYGLRGAVYTYMNAADNGDVSVGGLKAMARAMGITLKGGV